VLRANLPGEKDEFLGAVAVVVLIDDDLKAYPLDVANPKWATSMAAFSCGVTAMCALARRRAARSRMLSNLSGFMMSSFRLAFMHLRTRIISGRRRLATVRALTTGIMPAARRGEPGVGGAEGV